MSCLSTAPPSPDTWSTPVCNIATIVHYLSVPPFWWLALCHGCYYLSNIESLPLDTEWNKHFPASKFVAICNSWAKSKLPNLLLKTSTSQFHLASSTYFFTELPYISSSMWCMSSSTLLTVFILWLSIFWRLEIAFSLSLHEAQIHAYFRNQSILPSEISSSFRNQRFADQSKLLQCSPALNSHGDTIEWGNNPNCFLIFYLYISSSFHGHNFYLSN